MIRNYKGQPGYLVCIKTMEAALMPMYRVSTPAMVTCLVLRAPRASLRWEEIRLGSSSLPVIGHIQDYASMGDKSRH